MIKNTLIVAGLVIAIGVSLVAIARPINVKVSMPEKAITAGSVTGPDILSPYFSFGGVRQWGSDAIMAQGTTTVCALQSPSATTTLTYASANFVIGTTTASTVYIHRSSTAFATTTKLAQLSVAANATPVLVSTSTLTALTDGIIAPNSFIVVSMSGGTGTFSPTGSCNAIFTEVN